MKKEKVIKIFAASCLSLIIMCSNVLAGNNGNYFNGTYKLGEYRGVKGNIECDPVTVSRDVSIWIMLADSTTSNGYIQVGWGKASGQTRNWHFYQANGDYYIHQETSVASTGTHSYQIEQDDSDWIVKVNGSNVGTVSIDDLGWNVDHAEFFGEIHDDTEDQNPGTVSDPETMGYLKLKNSSGTWENARFTIEGITDLTHQKNNIRLNAYTFEQWDSRY